MERFAALAVPVIMLCLVVRVIMLPIEWFWKLGLNTGCGFVCLWLMNSIAGFTGIYFPINAITALIAGFLGVPGMILLALIQLVL